MAAIPKEKPPEGFSYLKWEEVRQQSEAMREGFIRWRKADSKKSVAESRLEWVVKFIKTDLDTLSERDRLIDSYVLRSMTGKTGIAVGKKGPGVVATTETTLRAMELADLKKIQKRIAEGVRGLAGTHGFEWEIPGPKVFRVYRTNEPLRTGRGDTEVPQKLQLQVMWEWGDNQIAPILYEIAGLLWTCGANLRLCKGCGQPFLGKKRGLYCPESNCGQTLWDANREKKKAEMAKATRSAKRRATT